jgi:hypothetical protein
LLGSVVEVVVGQEAGIQPKLCITLPQGLCSAILIDTEQLNLGLFPLEFLRCLYIDKEEPFLVLELLDIVFGDVEPEFL